MTWTQAFFMGMLECLLCIGLGTVYVLLIVKWNKWRENQGKLSFIDDEHLGWLIGRVFLLVAGFGLFAVGGALGLKYLAVHALTSAGFESFKDYSHHSAQHLRRAHRLGWLILPVSLALTLWVLQKSKR